MKPTLPKHYNLELGMKAKEENFNKGKYWEKVALEYLQSKGFELVEQNFSTNLGVKGEIDLIMRDKDRLVFVEVKYKYNDRLGIPEEMIDRRKISKVKRVAEIYIVLNKPKEEKYRIDAVCILGSKITHYENI